MKTLLRAVPAVALCAAALLFSGCIANKSARGPRVERLPDFSIVESSTAKALTAGQLEELRQAVVAHLEEQGYRDGRLYYVKVTFDAREPGLESQWVIVRIGNLPERTYTVLAAYPGADDSLLYDQFYRYGYYDRYGPLSQRHGYYYDPFDYYPTGGGYYGPTRPPTVTPPVTPDKPDKPGGRPDPKPDHPRGTPTRWDNNRRDRLDRHGEDSPRQTRPEPWNRERTERRPDYSRPNPDNYRPERNTYNPPSAPAYTPPPAPVRSAPPEVREERDITTPQPKER